MKLQQNLILAKYIANLHGKDHRWGELDCCTVFLECHDALWGTDKAKPVKGKYHSKGSAVSFYKNMKLTWRQWLFTNNYRQVEDDLKEGDIAVLDHRLFPTVYIYHNKAFWTMSEDRNLVGVDATALQLNKAVTVWRHK